MYICIYRHPLNKDLSGTFLFFNFLETLSNIFMQHFPYFVILLYSWVLFEFTYREIFSIYAIYICTFRTV